MNKSYRAIMAFLIVVALSAPTWTYARSNTSKQCSSSKSWYQKQKAKWHEKMVLFQFYGLKYKYNRSMDDAQQMFLEYLGSAAPGTNPDLEQIKAEYEQQIAALNQTLSSLQQQLSDAEAAYQQQLTALQADFNAQLAAMQADYQQQLADQQAAHVADLTQQLADLAAECATQVADAYQDGEAAGLETCAASGPAGEPQLQSSIITGTYYPYAVDGDNTGNFFILDDYYMTVAQFDGAGTQLSQWTSPSFQQPLDLAVDSQGSIYVLDQLAPNHLQKYSAGGQPVALDPNMPALVGTLGGLFIDSQDNVYVTDMGGQNGGRIVVLNSSGALVNVLGDVPELPYEAYNDVAVDEQNNAIYVVTNNRVAKLNMAGGFVTSWQGSFNRPSSVAVGLQGQVFVSDAYNNEIYQFDGDGNLMYTVGTSELQVPSRISVDSTGRLYVADYFNQQVRIYR